MLIFFVPSRRLITRGARALDQRLGEREELDAEIGVEFLRDVTRQFEMLLLVFAHRHMRALVDEMSAAISSDRRKDRPKPPHDPCRPCP